MFIYKKTTKTLMVLVICAFSLNGYGMQRVVAKKIASLVAGASYAGYSYFCNDKQLKEDFENLSDLLPDAYASNSIKCRSILENHGLSIDGIKIKAVDSAVGFHAISRENEGILLVSSQRVVEDKDIFAVLHEGFHIKDEHTQKSSLNPPVVGGVALALASAYVLRSPTALRAILRVSIGATLFTGSLVGYPRCQNLYQEAAADKFATESISKFPSREGLFSLYYMEAYYRCMHIPKTMFMLTRISGENYFNLPIEEQVVLADSVGTKMRHYFSSNHPMDNCRADQILGSVESIRKDLSLSGIENDTIKFRAQELAKNKVAHNIVEMRTSLK